MRLKYKFIFGGIGVGLFHATFPFAIICYNNDKIKIKIFLITIFNFTKDEIKGIQKIDDDLIKITTTKSREILFGCFQINKLIEGLKEKGFIVD